MIRFSFIFAIVTITLQTGCITLFSKTEIVRAEETRRLIRFENQEVADQFHAALKSRDREVGSSYVGVPFVTVYAKERKLAEVAAWNDAVLKCDTDQDGTITQTEASIFSKWAKD